MSGCFEERSKLLGNYGPHANMRLDDLVAVRSLQRQQQGSLMSAKGISSVSLAISHRFATKITTQLVTSRRKCVVIFTANWIEIPS